MKFTLIKKHLLVLILICGFLMNIAHAGLITTTFTSNVYLDIPGTDTSGPASIYPTTIDVSGLTGTIVDLNVTLFGLSSSWTSDLSIALMNPNHEAVYLMHEAGNDSELHNVELTFDDQATHRLPDYGEIPSGRYQVSEYVDYVVPLNNFSGVYGSDLSNFNGAAPNGAYQLYIWDQFLGDTGSLQGWSINITTATIDVPEPSTIFILITGILLLSTIRYKQQP